MARERVDCPTCGTGLVWREAEKVDETVTVTLTKSDVANYVELCERIEKMPTACLNSEARPIYDKLKAALRPEAEAWGRDFIALDSGDRRWTGSNLFTFRCGQWLEVETEALPCDQNVLAVGRWLNIRLSLYRDEDGQLTAEART